MLLSNPFENLLCRFKRKQITLMFLIYFLINSLSAPLVADENKAISTYSIDTVYDLISDGDDIGDISSIRSQLGDPGCCLYLVEDTVSLKASGFWGPWELTIIGKTVIDKEGILGFDYKIKEDDNSLRVFGDRHDRELWCNGQQVWTKKDEEDTVVISSMVIADTLPCAEETLKVIGMLSENGNNKGEIRISLESFDTASSQLPSILMRKPQGLGKGKVRLLDTSELKIETHKYEEVDQEQIEIAKKTFKCRVFSIARPKGKSTSWIAEDELGAFVVKESGKDEDGPYELILKQYKITKG